MDRSDKVAMTAAYDEVGRCRYINIYLNDPNLTVSEVAAAVRAIFKPDGALTVSPPTTWTPPTTAGSYRGTAVTDTTELRITDGQSHKRGWLT